MPPPQRPKKAQPRGHVRKIVLWPRAWRRARGLLARLRAAWPAPSLPA